MERNPIAPHEAATDEPAFFSDPSIPDDPDFATLAEQDAYWAGFVHGARVGNAPAPDGGEEEPPRQVIRHDGWTPVRMARFLETLTISGVVADACRASGMSVASAYALRNRRNGRAFALAWDAVLIHRARARLSDEMIGRAMNGYVETISKDGEVVAERRRFDNRLSMAVLTRLDKLAEGQGGREQTLRAVSEDLPEMLDCIYEEGDLDAFVAARTRIEEPEPDLAELDHYDALARVAGCSDHRDVDPGEIDVSDLNPDHKDKWNTDGLIRAVRSYYIDWLEMMEESEAGLPDGEHCAAEFHRVRAEILARIEANEAGEPSMSSTSPAQAPVSAEAQSGEEPSMSSTSPAAPTGAAEEAPGFDNPDAGG